MTIGVLIAVRTGTMGQIKKGSIYIFDDGFHPSEIIIALESEEKLRYDEDIIYNKNLDFVEVLIKSKIDSVLVAELYEVERIIQ